MNDHKKEIIYYPLSTNFISYIHSFWWIMGPKILINYYKMAGWVLHYENILRTESKNPAMDYKL